MITIYKYPILIGQQDLSIRGFLKALSVREQNGYIVLYYLVDSTSPSLALVEVLVLGTGQEASDTFGFFFVGSIELPVIKEIYHTFINVR